MSQQSSPSTIYLDHAATTPLLPEAREAWLEGMAIWANPSSPHKSGRAARAALEDARERLKKALGWQGEVIFTSGASEALAVGLGRAKAGLSAVSAVEHDAVLRLSGAVARIGVDADCKVLPGEAAMSGLVAVQHVNSETGVIQPLDRVAAVVADAGGVLLADCAQSACKLAIPKADLVAIGAHKFGGPIGVGGLLLRDWGLLEPTGGQERGYRAGTENLPGALAMVAAIEAGSLWMAKAARLRKELESGIIASGGEVVAANAERIATIGSYRMPGKPALAQLIRFDGMGIAVSAGSACSSGSLKTSHVLEAMGYSHPNEVIRVSIGRETTQEEIEAFLSAWRAIAGVEAGQ